MDVLHKVVRCNDLLRDEEALKSVFREVFKESGTSRMLFGINYKKNEKKDGVYYCYDENGGLVQIGNFKTNHFSELFHLVTKPVFIPEGELDVYLDSDAIRQFSLLNGIAFSLNDNWSHSSSYFFFANTSGEILSLSEIYKFIIALSPYIHFMLTNSIASCTPKEGSDFDVLSEREKQVLALLCNGYTDKSISNELGIAHATVRNHFSKILCKLSAKNRIDLVKRAIKFGLYE